MTRVKSACTSMRAVVAVIVALMLVGVVADAAAAARVRKRASELTPAEKQEFIDAVKGMKPPNANTYDPFVTLHAALPSGAYPHNAAGLLVWHREYLLRVENAMRIVKPNVTIPYWDWTFNGFPSHMTGTNNNFLGGSGNPVTTGPFAAGLWTVAPGPACLPPNLRRSFASFSLPTPASIAAALALNTYQSFSPAVSGPHGSVHGWVGGQMGAYCSPADPVFWMHHAMLDRLWCKWQAAHPQSVQYVPNSGDPGLNDSMPYFSSATPGSTLKISTHGGGYRYDDCSCLPRPANMVMWLADCNAADLLLLNPGVWQGTPTCPIDWKVGGQALNFIQSNNNWVSVSSKPSINFGTAPFTADLWIKPLSVSGTRTLLEKTDSVRGFAIFLQNGSLCVRIRGGSVTHTSCSGGTVVPNAWQYISAIFHRGAQEAVTVTVNDVGRSLLLSGTSVGNINNNAPLRIGSSAEHPTLYSGIMDEIELYNTRVDYNELLAIYKAGAFGKCRPTRTIKWPFPADRCRAAVAKAGEGMIKGLLKAVTKCHKVVQSSGSPPVNCNDISAMPAADVAKVRAKVAQTITSQCAAIVPPNPADADFRSCPPPCGGTPILDFTDLATCVSCIGERVVAGVSEEVLGNPRGRARQTPERKCHDTIAKAQTKYIGTVLKQMNKCQKAAEEEGADTTAGCDDPSADPKVVAARAKGIAKINKHCTAVDLSGVDSCTPFPSCVFDSDTAVSRQMFQQLHTLDAVPVCGNGLLEDFGGETCDTRGDSATCDGDCTAPACGDAIVNRSAGEQCDDGNLQVGDGCSATCTVETFCYCDGPGGSSTFCHPRSPDPSLACTYEETCVCPTCGDGTVDSPAEQCDDAGESAACDADCTFVTCGDGRVNVTAGEGCDGEPGTTGTSPGPGMPCLTGCVLNQCGDGDACTNPGCTSGPGGGPEQCDDGNNLDGDGCSAICARENACGDNIVDGDLGEQCDGSSDAACPAACAAPATPFACTCPTGETCSGDPIAGDGIQGGTCTTGSDVGQPCDVDGPSNTSSQCTP